MKSLEQGSQLILTMGDVNCCFEVFLVAVSCRKMTAPCFSPQSYPMAIRLD